MAGSTMEEVSQDVRLKAALWYSIGRTVDAVALAQDINTSTRFIGGLSEMVFDRINTAAIDLEAFAKHADRSIINTRDVILLGRHNDSLKSILQDHANSVRERDANR